MILQFNIYFVGPIGWKRVTLYMRTIPSCFQKADWKDWKDCSVGNNELTTQKFDVGACCLKGWRFKQAKNCLFARRNANFYQQQTQYKKYQTNISDLHKTDSFPANCEVPMEKDMTKVLQKKRIESATGLVNLGSKKHKQKCEY